MVLEGVLIRRVIHNFDLLFSSLLDSTRVGDNADRGLELGFPGEMEAELTVVLESDLADLALVNEEFSKVEGERLGFLNLSKGADFNSLGLTSEDLVVDLVTFSLDVESQGSGLPLHIADQVVVIGQLELGAESDF